jgi:hypothetical protein
MNHQKRYCLYAYTIKNKATDKPTGFKIGITTLRNDIDDEYKAIEHRINQECVHQIKSRLGEPFIAGNIYFCICLDEEDPLYDKSVFGRTTYSDERNQEYFKTRCRYYEKMIHSCLIRDGFHRTDMYRVSSNNVVSNKTEFFHMKNSDQVSITSAIDAILAHPDDGGRLNIDTNAERWYHCSGCCDYARDDRGQICDLCRKTWCHKRCSGSYKKRHPTIVYDFGKGEFTCHECISSVLFEG